MKKFVLAAGIFAATLVGGGIATEVQANEKNPNIVHRQGIYKVVGGHMNSLQAALFLGGSGNPVYHAEGILAAWQNMGKSFPEGSGEGKTRAKAAIWENMADYQSKGKAAYGATLKLVEAAKSGDKGATVAAFKELGGTCKACHKEYREK